MVSSTLLLLPVIAIKAGYMTTSLLAMFFGALTFYTARLLVVHIGQEKMPHMFILHHFHNDYRYLIFFNFIVWVGYFPIFVIFLKIIVINTQGLLGYHSVWVAPIVALALVFAIIIVRIFIWGENTLASGIITIIAYLLFLTFAQFTAPVGPKTVPAFGPPIDMSAFMIMAFTVHSFMPQNMLKNP